MKTIKLFITAVFLLLVFFAFAQTADEKYTEQPYIEVTGTAEKEVIPDEIFISITIREKYENKTKVTIEEQENKLKIALTLIGVDLKNLYLSDADADWVKVRWQRNDVLTQIDYTLKVADAATIGKVFKELDVLEIKDAYISKVSHSRIDSLRKEVKIMAIKAAKDKADYLLAAIGEQAGKPMIIRENEIAPFQNGYANIRGNRSDGLITIIDGVKMDYLSDYDIEFEKIKIQTTIYVKFSIK